MSKEKRSFFERLTGTIKMDEIDAGTTVANPHLGNKKNTQKGTESWIDTETDQDGELSVDVYQTADMIVIKV